MMAARDVNNRLKEAIHTGEPETEYLFHYNPSTNYEMIELKYMQVGDQFR